MKKTLLMFVVFAWTVSCSEHQPAQSSPAGSDSPKTSIKADSLAKVNDNTIEGSVSPSAWWRNSDTLLPAEKSFLKRLADENPNILYSDKVMRYYGKDSSLLFSKLVFPDGYLRAKGYIYFDLTAEDHIDKAHITYNFSAGQADTGYGSIAGEDSSDYMHTMKACGVTACVVQVYQNGRKIFEKWK